MKITSKHLYIFLLPIFLYACDSFQSIDSRIINYVDQIDQNVGNMTEKDWQEADLQIESFQKVLEESKSDLSEIQINNANQAIGKYGGLRIKQGIGDFKNQLKDLGEQIKGAMKELVDTLDNQNSK